MFVMGNPPLSLQIPCCGGKSTRPRFTDNSSSHLRMRPRVSPQYAWIAVLTAARNPTVYDNGGPSGHLGVRCKPRRSGLDKSRWLVSTPYTGQARATLEDISHDARPSV